LSQLLPTKEQRAWLADFKQVCGMSISDYIREIGRGKEGARSLDQAQAHDLMSQVLDGKVSDLEVGAFVLAMRIKGESLEELAGFLEATQDRCIALRSVRATVVLPSYNGARRLPNLTPLLALLLAQQGVNVLVHGMPEDPARVTSAEVFRKLGLSIAHDTTAIESAWSRREPVFLPTGVLCPALAKLLDVRRVVGVRNSGHTVAKLLSAFSTGPSIRVVNYTHPEYARLLSEFLSRIAAHALLLRGTEGEPVADPRRTPKLDVFIDGKLREDLSPSAQIGVLTELPVLPREHDAQTTARYIQSVMNNQQAVPSPIAIQVSTLMKALGEIGIQKA
jgi:anthranilate phosphoribosyltransferase